MPSDEFIEPFTDTDGSIGFSLVHPDGYHELLSYQSVRTTEDEKDRKALELLAKISSQYKRPLRPNFAKFNAIWESVYNLAPPKDTPEVLEFQREYMSTVLTDISQRIVGFVKELYYFEDERDYDVLAVFIISSYFRSQFNKMPLMIYSAVSAAGKSTLLKIISLLIYRGHIEGSYTAASIIDNVNGRGYSMLMDEALLNLSMNLGPENALLRMLTTSWDREIATQGRYDQKGKISDIKAFFTNYVLTVRGDLLNEDMRSRSIITTLSLPKAGIELKEIEDIDEDFKDSNFHPDTIRTDLYTLKIMTDAERFKGFKERGIWFETFRREAIQDMKYTDDYGSYLYGLKQNIPNAPKLKGRTRDMAAFFYTIGLATGTARNVMLAVLDNDDSVALFKTETTESVLFAALCNLIIIHYEEFHPTLYGVPPIPITAGEFATICKKIKTVDIWAEYGNIRKEFGGWDPKDIEDSRTLAAKFRQLGIPYAQGGARANFLASHDSKFIPKFKEALRVYGDDKSKFLLGDL